MRCELFDLKTDPGEKTDLSSQNPAKKEELRNALHQWRVSVHANMLRPNPTHEQHADSGLD
jgi:hypothetical protein